MPTFTLKLVLILAVILSTCALSLVLTPLTRSLSAHFGWVARPSGSRWHRQPTPLFGGVAIFLSVAILVAPFLPRLWEPRLLALLAGAVIVFAVGLWDDFVKLRPVTKLLGQIIAACIVVAGGVMLNMGEHKFLSVLVTILWIAAVTNAFNLIDNMDGLCAGTAVISSVMLVVYSVMSADPLVGLFAASLAGASLGFLRYNFSPASIFMGDCGSMFIGFLLAVLSVWATSSYVGDLAATLMVPVLVLSVPIFDTTFVSFTRLLRGQSIAQGGRDHASHRLVILGLSERRTVLLIYAFSLIMGATAVLYSYFTISIFFVVSMVLVSGAVVFGLFLGEVKIGEAQLPAVMAQRKSNPPAVLFATVLHKRSFVEMLLDVVSICLAYYTATLLRYENELTAERLTIVWRTLPVLISVKLVSLYAMGLYRSMWRYLAFADLIHVFRAATIASVLSVLAVLMIWNFKGYSRTVFVIDWLITLMLLSGTRLLFRGLRETLPGIRRNSGKRVLIVGAGDAGEMLVKEMLNNPRLGYQPVGFLDDNPAKRGLRMYGVEVMGTRADLGRILIEERVEEVVIAIPSAEDEALLDFFVRCGEVGVPCRRMQAVI
ncbi:MAG: hypothetical protein HYZ11_00460 [Candidatus Tectomicrobia bacterium]|uniref:Glycosyl transferase n=1 Tax=Tectimicrobiota bacterium TaxID=2528274 RepID=A0A932HUT2_UNCTE|nr:hypothetical protein [Candidatus Tectomicrobia bacterium]